MPAPAQDRGHDVALEKRIDEAIDRRIREKVMPLVWGAGGVVVFLTALNLTFPAVLLKLVGTVLGKPVDALVSESVEKGFAEQAVPMVSYSYSNQFVLDGKDGPFHSVPFYLRPDQTAELICDVLHTETEPGKAVVVEFDVDESGKPQIIGRGDQTGARYALSSIMRSAASTKLPTVDNLHSLTFRIDPTSGSATDRVIISRCVINIEGLELRRKP